MPYEIRYGTAGGLGFEGENDAVTVDAPDNVVKISCICLGAGGGGGPSGGGDPSGGGGGGGGLTQATLKVDPFGTIRIRAGGGGQGSTSTGIGSVSGTDGKDSLVRTNYGEKTGNGGKGGRTFNGGNGGNGNVRDGQSGEDPALIVPFFSPNGCRGGGAAGLNSTAGRGANPGDGGNGINFVISSTGFSTSVVSVGGSNNGANYGGGGGGSVDEGGVDFGGGDQAPVQTITNTRRPGGGGGGIAFAGWVTLTAPKTVLRSGEPVVVSYNDSLNNTGTETVSFTNETEANETREYVFTDDLGAQSKITFTVLPKVKITSLTATPNPQTSGLDGIPNYDTFLIWEGISVLSAVATRSDGEVSATWEQREQPTDPALPPVFYTAGSKKVENLFQSVSTGSSQPGSDTTYTLTATDGFNTATATVTVKAYNDNCPDNITIADQLGKEPLEEVKISTSPITGIDMVTNVTCGPGVQVLTQLSTYSTFRTITSGSSLNLRVFAEPFNTDENGLVNEKTVFVTIGCLTVEFLVQTRAPIVEEIFDFGDNQFAYPFPKIDTREIGEPLDDGGTYQEPTDYLKSPTIVEPSADAWEVELEAPFGVQIRAKDIRYSPPTSTQFNDISSQNDTDLEVNVRRQGGQPNNTWTKPNII